LADMMTSWLAYSPYTLFSVGEQGVWFDPSDVANLDWRRNISLNSDAETLWAAAGTTPPTVALSQTYLSKTCAAITFAAGTGAGFSVSRADRALTGGTYNITSGTTYVMSYEISFSRALTGSEAIGVLQTGVQGINGFTFNASNTSDLVGAWLRISSPSALATASGTNYPVVNVAGAITASPVTVYVRAIQVEAGSVATDYQRITDVNTEVIERFPTATLYQDTAGTTPVTTTGQSVGLMLDKSKGLVRGSELVTNGGFATDTDWTKGTGCTIVGGKAVMTAATGFFSQSLTGISLGLYEFTVVVDSVTSGILSFEMGGSTGNDFSIVSAGTYVFRRYWAGLDPTIYLNSKTDPVTAVIDSVSLKLVSGNHAVQATTANRPIYGIHPVGGRRNLLVRTQDFSNAIWLVGETNATATKGTVSSGRPDGSSGTVDTLTFSSVPSTADSHAFSYQVLSATYLNVPVTFSVWMRVASGTGSVFLNVEDTGAAPSSGNFFASPALSLNTTWQRFVLTGTRTSVTGNAAAVIGFDTRVAAGQTNASSLTVQVWGAQFETGSTATAYQRVTDQYNVTEAGVPSVSYLFFDGVNDSLATPSINFATATSDGQARRNLLTFPTAFNESDWLKIGATVTANAAVAPDGTMTADALIETTAASSHTIYRIISGVTTYTHSFYAKANGRTQVQVEQESGGNARFTLSGAGTAVALGANTVSITSVGDGWYRCSTTFTPTAGFGIYTNLYNGSTISYTGDGTSGVFLWGAQLETGTTASAFQNIGTDKMTVFAGVRKLSDAARGALAELGVGGPLGSFGFFAPSAANAGYNFTSTGGSTPSSAQTTAYAAPITNVLTGLGDISGDTSTLRVNGTQVAQSTIDQGPGNYTTQPLFIGARAGTSLFFSGHLYSLIVRGAQSNTGQISSTETWVASRTGIVI
jgi:hypothetical protein